MTKIDFNHVKTVKIKMPKVESVPSVFQFHDEEIRRLSDFLIEQMIKVIKNLEKSSNKDK